MKSKISFFNRTIFRKNVTLFWPVWSCYLVFLLISIPGVLWMHYMKYKQNLVWWEGSGENSYQLEMLSEILNFELMLGSICIMAVVTGMLLFHYLCVAKNAYMIHAFPVTRRELFWTNVITGLSFMIVPQILTFLISMVVCLAFGMTHVEYLAIYLLMQIGVDLLMYSIVVFCAMVTGQMVAIPIFFVALNVLYLAVRLLIRVVFAVLSYGMDLVIVDRVHSSDVLSPFIYLAQRVMIDVNYQDDNIKGLSFGNASYIAWYLIPAAALYVISYLFYRRRHLENAGDLVTVGFVRPLFRWGVGFFAAYILGLLDAYVVHSVAGNYSLPLALIGGLIGGAVFFFLAQMLLEKSFHIFRMRTVKECGCFCVFLLASFAALYTMIGIQENYIPKEQDIEKAKVTSSCEITFEAEDVAKVLEMHREILDYAEQYHSGRLNWEETFSIGITYTLKDGNVVERFYDVPVGFVDNQCFSFFREEEEDPEQFLSNLFLMNEEFYDTYLEEISLVVWEDGWDDNLEIYSAEKKNDTATTDIYDALYADAAEGNLQKYNIERLRFEGAAMGYAAALYIKYTLPVKYKDKIEQSEFFQAYSYQNDDNSYVCSLEVFFGPDCTHILELLEKYELIDSPEELPDWED